MQLFHVLSRGVDKRKIFLDTQDHFRFVHDLYEFNNKESVNTSQLFSRRQCYDVRRHNIEKKGGRVEKRERKLLVNIHVFAIMPNHYHLLLSSVHEEENTIPLFMKKLNGGYAKYFNQKYDRKGTLFESRYKAIEILHKSHFLHIPYYIHCNRLDLFMPEWRGRELKDPGKAVNFLRKDRWSSHLDYCGEKNFPSVTQREFLLDFFGGSKEYEKSMKQWLKNISIESVSRVASEVGE